METKVIRIEIKFTRTTLAVLLGLALLLAGLWVVGAALAQPPDSGAGGPLPPEPESAGEGEATVMGELAASGVVSPAINYQGRLTDPDGNPLDGTYDMEFQLWDAESGGNQVGSTITVNNVDVDKGLFNTRLEVDADDFNGQELWLRVRAREHGGAWDDWMTPRQQILPVPYALSLRPGAVISDTSSYVELNRYRKATWPLLFSWKYGVYAESEGGATFNYGLYGSGSDTGVYGYSDSGSGVYGYSGTGAAIHAGGTGTIESTASSYWWISGNQIVVDSWLVNDEIRLDGTSGGTCINATSGNAGDYDNFVIPLDIPGVLYGQNVSIESVRVYYKVDNADDYIDNTRLRRTTGAGTYDTLASDSTDKNSITATYYDLTPASPVELSDGSGPLVVSMDMHFTGTGSNREIHIGMIRVTLLHD